MQSSEHTLQKLISTLFPMIGAALLLGAVISTVFTYRFITLAAKAEGRVVRLNASGAHPVIQFTPAGGSIVEFSSSGFITYAVGDQVTVLYVKDAQTPSGFRVNIDNPGALWAPTFVLVVVGTAMVVDALYVRYRSNNGAK